ncbi:unnamed protein product [Rhodiola kirilowii]
MRLAKQRRSTTFTDQTVDANGIRQRGDDVKYSSSSNEISFLILRKNNGI